MTEDKEEPELGGKAIVTTLGLLLLVSAVSFLVVKVARPRKKEPPSSQPAPAAEPVRRTSTGKALPANVAGQFYPGEAARLQATVDDLLAGAPSCGLRRVRAIVALGSVAVTTSGNKR